LSGFAHAGGDKGALAFVDVADDKVDGFVVVVGDGDVADGVGFALEDLADGVGGDVGGCFVQFVAQAHGGWGLLEK